ncbi:hypothetical protein M409DRAFT_68727 [Zasmidium cellare ATCC 36951]|uniref:RRM domain-containing protein n=1 Tax=Zasmidium cellare ATCC 36951 TaxID=1080233 RepID=A0A6A6C8E1_ZASCE|nr:uncharacterized protein M409DRAFT_68727 [Zasmidium cellare ATCC 36951]KAF2163103.1 hypothetical protein M409DRAFT_68727 [Zasmidium cellare ATCC 36951]
MSGEDDTFDIDIYGDDGQEPSGTQQEYAPEDRLEFDDDDFGYDGANDAQGSAQHNDNSNGQNGPSDQAQQDQEKNDSAAGASQGTKRKAEEQDYGDEEYRSRQPSASTLSHQQPTDPSATAALKIHDLHWWTTEEDLRAFCATASVEDQLRDVMFGEHKINGKSRGEAYLEFSNPAAADAVKKAIEVRSPPNAEKGETEGKRANSFHVYFSPIGNPFKGRDSGAQTKKEFTPSHGGRGGAYNNFNNRGGGFRGGDRGNFNNRGGGYNNRGGFQGGMNQQQGGWNAGAMGGMGGGFNNPMMSMGNMGMMNGMNMGNYGNMGRGGMMNRGGFGGMGGMGMGMGGGRGNMMGGGRGGWGGGFQQGGMQGGYGGGFNGGMGMGNKRMKPDG